MIKDIDQTRQNITELSVITETREIFLHPKSSDDETDIALAMQFIKTLRLLENINKNNIIIHHYNHGGRWSAGIAIYDAIKASDCFIIMVCHGECQSAGMLILQAADLRLVYPHCELMIHEGTSSIHSDLSHKAAKSWSTIERQKEELLYDIFTEKCMEGTYFKTRQYKKNRVKGYLKTQIAKQEDWIVSPADAKEYGFIDGIIGEDKYPNVASLIK